MKIILSFDDGEVIDTIEHIEEYDLSRPLHVAAIIAKILSALKYIEARTKRRKESGK